MTCIVSLSTLNYLPLPPIKIKRNMYFGEFRESRTGSNIIFRGWGGEKDVEWEGRKGRSCSGLPLAFIIMSSDPNLYSMPSGLCGILTVYSIRKSHLPWLQVMMLIISGQLSVTWSLLNFSVPVPAISYLSNPKLPLLGLFVLHLESPSHIASLGSSENIVPRNLSKLSKPKPRD